MKELFENYKTPLLFDYFAKQDKISMDKASSPSIKYKIFAKFAMQLQVAHSLVSLDDLQVIFKQVIKEKPKTENTIMTALLYEDFLEVLTRIAAASKEKLLKSSEDPAATTKLKQKGPITLSMKGMTKEILESLLKFLNLDPNDTKSSLLSKLKNDSSKGETQKIKKESTR